MRPPRRNTSSVSAAPAPPVTISSRGSYCLIARSTARSVSGWVIPVLSSRDAHVSFGLTATRRPATSDRRGTCARAAAIASSICRLCVMTTSAMFVLAIFGDHEVRSIGGRGRRVASGCNSAVELVRGDCLLIRSLPDFCHCSSTSFLTGFGLADQAVPDLIRHPILRGVRVVRRRRHVGSGRKLLPGIACEIDVRRALLQPRTRWNQGHLFQLLVIKSANSVSALAEVECRQV